MVRPETLNKKIELIIAWISAFSDSDSNNRSRKDNKPTAFKQSMFLCTYMDDTLVPLLILNNFLYISLKTTSNLSMSSVEYFDQRCPPYTLLQNVA